MNFQPSAKFGMRPASAVAVVLVHIAFVWAFANGLTQRAFELVRGPVEARVIEEKSVPPPPPEKLESAPPVLRAPPAMFVPIPEVIMAAPPVTRMIALTTPIKPPAGAIAPIAMGLPKSNVAKPMPRVPSLLPKRWVPADASSVCTKMGKPEVPAVDWSGVALFKATATVSAGHVVAVSIESQNRGLSRRAKQSLLASIDATLRNTYVCPGDHVFSQEFLFRIE